MLEIMPDGTPVLKTERLTCSPEEEKKADLTNVEPDMVWCPTTVDLSLRVPDQWEPSLSPEYKDRVSLFYEDGGSHLLNMSYKEFDRQYMEYLRNRPMRIPQAN